MGRRKSEAPIRSEVIHVRIVPSGVQMLDEMRGTASRSEFLRTLLREEHQRRTKNDDWRTKSRALYGVPREPESLEPREPPENPWES